MVKLPFPLLFPMHKVCKAYLSHSVSYLIRCYWDTGGCKINCMDVANYTGCFDACHIHQVTSCWPLIQVVGVSQGRESKQLWVSQDGRAGSQRVCHVTETEWTQSFVWAPGMNPAQVLRKTEGARSRKAGMKRRGRETIWLSACVYETKSEKRAQSG